MTDLLIILALAAVVISCVSYGCWDAYLRARFADTERDWREDWCVPECYADHRQQGPCKDCPARRHGRRAM